MVGNMILLQENMWINPGNIKIAHRHMNVEIGTEAGQFLFWESINGIFDAVLLCCCLPYSHCVVKNLTKACE